jgi:ribonuclease Z
MARLYGTDPSQPNNVWDVLRDLRCIFVSHAHGDHQVGVPLILAKRAAVSRLIPVRKPYLNPDRHLAFAPAARSAMGGKWSSDTAQPTRVAGSRRSRHQPRHAKRSSACQCGRCALETNRPKRPTKLSPALDERGRVRSVQRSALISVTNRSSSSAFLVGQELSQALNLSRISTVDVDHGCKASGVVIDGKEGWRIVYSGDTRPCTQLAGAGVGATLLVHEASFGDDEYEKAEHKKHSTISEAIDIARQYVPSSAS